MSQGSSARAILYAFIANLGIALAKLAAALYTKSGSMLAESIHSFADTGNQVLLYVGLRQSARPADERHPLGYGKTSYFWSFIVALMLFSMGGLFSIYEGWHKLQVHEGLNKAWVAISVLAVSIVLEAGSLAGCVREINKVRRGRSFRHWLRETRNAELVVVLGEDIAALVGLVLALLFISLAAATGNPVYDAAGSIAIGVVLICVSIFIAIRIKGLIIGRSAESDLRAALEELIRSDPAITELLNAITLQMGPQVMVAAKVRMLPDLPVERAAVHINQLEVRIKEKFPEVQWLFIEPDTVR